MGDASMVWRTRNEGLFLRIGAFLTENRLDPDPEHYRLAYAILHDPSGESAREAVRLTKDGARLGREELEALVAKATTAADAAVRAALEAEASDVGWPAMHAALARVDAVTAARLAPNDAQRIQRALEVHRVSGRPLSAWHTARPADAAPAPPLIALEPGDRAWLHARIGARFQAMLDAGLLDEVRALRARGDLHAELPSMRAVGYRQAWEFLDGGTPEAGFRDRAIFATRQLAKRQLTWLRGSLDARWFDPATDGRALEAALSRFLPADLRTA